MWSRLLSPGRGGLPYFGGEFLPEFKEGHYIIRMLTAPGTSSQASVRLGTAVTDELLEDPRVRSVAQQIGRAEQGEDTIGPEFSEFHVELQALAGGEEETAKDEIRTVLARATVLSNRFCGDEVRLEVRVEEGLIREIACSVHACVLCEVSALIMRQAMIGKDDSSLPQAERFWGGLKSGVAAIESVTATDLEVAWAIGESFPDRDFSIVDRTSFAVMHRLGIRQVSAFDDDFTVCRYGRDRKAAFEVVR